MEFLNFTLLHAILGWMRYNYLGRICVRAALFLLPKLKPKFFDDL